MDRLRQQVNFVLKQVTLYKTQTEDSYKIHCYIMAVNFYLGDFVMPGDAQKGKDLIKRVWYLP